MARDYLWFIEQGLGDRLLERFLVEIFEKLEIVQRCGFCLRPGTLSYGEKGQRKECACQGKCNMTDSKRKDERFDREGKRWGEKEWEEGQRDVQEVEQKFEGRRNLRGRK